MTLSSVAMFPAAYKRPLDLANKLFTILDADCRRFCGRLMHARTVLRQLDRFLYAP